MPEPLLYVTGDPISLVVSLYNTLPVADASNRGSFAVVLGGPGVADVLYVCLKKSDDTYAWVKLMDGDSKQWASVITGV